MKDKTIHYEMLLEFVFKISYLILALSTFSPFIYDSAIQPIFVKLTLVIGAVTILHRLFKFKKYRKMPCIILMALFCVSFAVSAIMNREYGIVDNGKWIIWTGLQFFALYVCDVERDVESYHREFKILSYIMIVYSTVASVVSLGMLITSYTELWKTADGELMIAGFTWGRLWGTYTDPNYGAVFSAIAILLSILFAIKKKGVLRALFVLSIVLNFLYLVFSDSRTGELALFGGLAVFLYFYLRRRLEHKKGIAKYVMILCTILVIGGGTLLGCHFIKASYNENLAPVFVKMFPKEDTKDPKKLEQRKTTVGRKQDIESDVSNGRFDLWQSAVEVWETSPVYGAGYTTFVPYAKEHTPKTYAVNNGGGDYNSMHNAFLNTLAFQGVIGFILYLALAGYMIWYLLRPIITETGEMYLYLAGMLACVGAVVISMMFLLEGTYTLSPGSFVLWVFAGYMVQFAYGKRRGGR